MLLQTIGWAEYIDYPEWGIDAVKAKVDTGARSSALHVENLEEIDAVHVAFDVIYSRRPPHKRKRVTAKVVKWARVRSSTGHYQKRCFVRARIKIGEIEREIELSLVSREKMLFRMLLGRKALEGHFLVDVSRRNLLTQSPRRRARQQNQQPPNID